MKARKHLAACLGLLLALLAPSAAQADFGIQPGSFHITATNSDGTIDTQAGSHPYQYTVKWHMNVHEDAAETADGTLRSLVVNLPPGMVGNPQAVPTCSRAQFEGTIPQCPSASQVGFARVGLAELGTAQTPVYSLSAPLGAPARIGLSIDNIGSFQDASVRTGADYGISIADVTVPTVLSIQWVEETIWGVPMDEGHLPERICQGLPYPEIGGPACAGDPDPGAFLSLPTSCNGPMAASVEVESLEEPGVFQRETTISTDEEEVPVGLTGCNQLDFNPSIQARPTTNVADSPSGLEFDLHVPQPPKVEPTVQTDTCEAGEWSGNPSQFEYQWLRNGTPISGATTPIYEEQDADAATALQCEVTAIGAAGVGHAVSTARPVPSPVPPTSFESSLWAGAPSIAVSGGVATCKPGTWITPSTLVAFSYQWFKNGNPVSGQTAATYTPGPAPYTLQCEVRGTRGTSTIVAFSPNQASAPPPATALPGFTTAPELVVEELKLPLATAHLKDTTITLPPGLVVNPSSANGLGACTPAQFGLHTPDPANCPDAAKLGTVEVDTPLLANPLPGAVYIATPYQNPFASLLAIYIAVNDPERGVVVKLAGEVKPDPQTGQLTTTFAENPQQPVEDFHLNFFGGAGGALRTPALCGRYEAKSQLTPWSSPEGADATPSDSFEIAQGASGGPCATSDGSRPNKPSFTAGTATPKAGIYSPFGLRLVRQDGSQELKAIDTTLPKGLTGRLAGVAECSNAQIAVAISRERPNQGATEKQSPSCPLNSEVGTVTVGAGAGPAPYYASGHAYLAGPYKGAPLSLAIITPAIAGPFDLGAVVTRVALHVDPETAQIHALSDPIPTILQGIPLDVRSVAVNLTRPDFSLNPTSCNPAAVLGTATSVLGQSASLTSPFQVGECAKLGFKPKLKIKLKGGTKRGDHPALTATVTYPKGSYANIAAASVGLPHSEFLDQAHIKTICTRVQFAANQCPKASIYGYAKAVTPLLDQPLQGPVYLRSSIHELPDLVADLNGQVHVVLAGRVDTNSQGGLRNTFEAVPDAPVSKFTLSMQGGKKGLLVNSENTCRKPQRAIARFTAQNGKVSDYEPVIDNGCKKKQKRRGAKHHR